VETSSFFILLPFALGIFFLIWQEDTIFPLIGCLLLGSLISSRFNPLLGFINIPLIFISDVLTNRNVMLTIFMFTEGTILFFIVIRNGFIFSIIKNLTRKLNSRNLSVFISLATLVTFIDRNFSAILVGLFSRPFAAKKKLSREKHSYIINTVSSSISTVIPFTSLIPLIITTIGSAFTSRGIGFSPIVAYFKSIPFQFYNFFALFVVLSTLVLDSDILLMKKYIHQNEKLRSKRETFFGFNLNSITHLPFRFSFYFVVGLIVTIFGVIVSWIIIGGKGYYNLTIMNVRNLQAIFAASFFSAIIVMILFIIITRTDTYKGFRKKSGSVSMALISTIFYMILASAVSALAEKIDISVSSMGFLLNSSFKPDVIPLLVFCLSSLVSFLSGSSMLTITTVLPLAIKVVSLNMTDPLLIDRITFATIGSVISGATFGDTNSPLSLNFIISTVSTEVSVSKHFKSQILYSILAVAITIVCGYVTFIFNITPYISIILGLIVIISLFMIIKSKQFN